MMQGGQRRDKHRVRDIRRGRRMHHEFEWPKPESKLDRDILRHVREHGCSIINVGPDENEKEPPFLYSVGLFANYNHPELIILGMRGEQAMTIINEVATTSRPAGHSSMARSQMRSWATTTRSAYWQDVNRLFPWEAGRNPVVITDQPLLKKAMS
jgi:Domain of unknown function (DUF4262)